MKVGDFSRQYRASWIRCRNATYQTSGPGRERFHALHHGVARTQSRGGRPRFGLAAKAALPPADQRE
jgi:hypothetical protein